MDNDCGANATQDEACLLEQPYSTYFCWELCLIYVLAWLLRGCLQTGFQALAEISIDFMGLDGYECHSKHLQTSSDC